MEKNEQNWLKACQKGDLEKFAHLYDLYIEKIYRFIYYKTQHKETAEDLTSQTFFKALSKISQFNIKSGYFSAWLYQIARNTVIDHYRQKKNDSNLEDFWSLSDQTNLARDVEIKIKLEKIDKYLSKLKASQREIMILRIWEGLSYKEIAEITGKNAEACKMSFSRSLKTLKQSMPAELLISLLINKII